MSPPTWDDEDVRDLVKTLLSHMDSLDRNAGTASPGEGFNGSDGQGLVIALHLACRTAFRAMYQLIGLKHTEEAKILSRSLLENTIRLRYLLVHHDQLEHLALRYRLWSLHEVRGLVLKQKAMNLVGAEEDLAQIDALIQEVRDAAVLRLRRFPSTTDIADEIGEPSLKWFWSATSLWVHGNGVSLAVRIPQNEEGTYQVALDGSPMSGVSTALEALQVFSFATSAWAALLGWETAREVEAFRDYLRPKVRELQDRAKALGLIEPLVEQGLEGQDAEP